MQAQNRGRSDSKFLLVNIYTSTAFTSQPFLLQTQIMLSADVGKSLRACSVNKEFLPLHLASLASNYFSLEKLITEKLALYLTRGSEMPQKAGCAGNIDGQTNGQTNRWKYTSFESNLAVRICLHVKFELDWTKHFQARVRK